MNDAILQKRETVKPVGFRMQMMPDEKVKLEELSKHYDMTMAEVIRQLIGFAHQSQIADV